VVSRVACAAAQRAFERLGDLPGMQPGQPPRLLLSATCQCPPPLASFMPTACTHTLPNTRTNTPHTLHTHTHTRARARTHAHPATQAAAAAWPAGAVWAGAA
jgi:hypothetical protein